jgi:hypothetical protein
VIGGWRYFDAMLRGCWLGLSGPLPHNWLFTGVPADPRTSDERKIMECVVMDAIPDGWKITLQQE